jgi:hypothetical protein
MRKVFALGFAYKVSEFNDFAGRIDFIGKAFALATFK